MTEGDRPAAGGHQIAGLALPALGVLAAEPLYLLFDTAVDWGLAGIWSGLTTFVVLRLIFVGWRAISGRWVG